MFSVGEDESGQPLGSCRLASENTHDLSKEKKKIVDSELKFEF